MSKVAPRSSSATLNGPAVATVLFADLECQSSWLSVYLIQFRPALSLLSKTMLSLGSNRGRGFRIGDYPQTEAAPHHEGSSLIERLSLR